MSTFLFGKIFMKNQDKNIEEKIIWTLFSKAADRNISVIFGENIREDIIRRMLKDQKDSDGDIGVSFLITDSPSTSTSDGVIDESEYWRDKINYLNGISKIIDWLEFCISLNEISRLRIFISLGYDIDFNHHILSIPNLCRSIRKILHGYFLNQNSIAITLKK